MTFAAKRGFRSGRVTNDRVTCCILHLTPPDPQASHRLFQHAPREKRSRPCSRACAEQNPPLRFPCRQRSMNQGNARYGPFSTRVFAMNRLFAALGLAAGALVTSAQAQNIPTIRVGWTIPAEEAKYWMMRRPQEFPDLGKTYKIEWSQFQGTSVMSQALIAGALDCATQGVLPIAQGAAAGTLAVYIVAEHVGEKPGSFSVYWAVKEESPIRTVADLKGKTVGISIIGGGTQGPIDLMLKRNGLDPQKDIKLVEVSFPLSEEAIRSGRVDSSNMNQPFAARAEAKGGIRKLFSLDQVLPNIVHIVEACR